MFGVYLTVLVIFNGILSVTLELHKERKYYASDGDMASMYISEILKYISTAAQQLSIEKQSQVINELFLVIDALTTKDNNSSQIDSIQDCFNIQKKINEMNAHTISVACKIEQENKQIRHSSTNMRKENKSKRRASSDRNAYPKAKGYNSQSQSVDINVYEPDDYDAGYDINDKDHQTRRNAPTDIITKEQKQRLSAGDVEKIQIIVNLLIEHNKKLKGIITTQNKLITDEIQKILSRDSIKSSKTVDTEIITKEQKKQLTAEEKETIQKMVDFIIKNKTKKEEEEKIKNKFINDEVRKIVDPIGYNMSMTTETPRTTRKYPRIKPKKHKQPLHT